MSNRLLATARNTFTDCAVTSGPMPSPGRTAIFIQTSPRSDIFAAIAVLEGDDLVDLGEREGHFIDAVQQAVPGERVDLERVARAVGQGNGLARQVDLHL